MILIFNTLLISLDVDILFILLNIIFVIPILFFLLPFYFCHHHLLYAQHRRSKLLVLKMLARGSQVSKQFRNKRVYLHKLP